jgi:hypothetical protein
MPERRAAGGSLVRVDVYGPLDAGTCPVICQIGVEVVAK